MLPRLYRTLTRLLGPLVLGYLQYRRRRGKEDAQRFGERLGRPGMPRPAGPLVWIHAASVGEAMTMLGLIERLLQTRATLEILVTTGTVASARLLEQRLPPRARHQFVPVDLPEAVARFLDHWRPSLALWVESELWPNLILAAHARGIPMLLVNGRLSTRSYRHWRWSPGLIAPILESFELCLAQDSRQASRLRQLGARHVAEAGDLKSAADRLPVDHLELARLERQLGTRPLWLAASTHPGEEEAAAEVHRRLAPTHRGLLTIVVPRHPLRGEAIGRMLAARGLSTARRSADEPITADTDVYIADTMGELGLFYSLSGIAFIGGSLSRNGGHNPFEAARLDCAVLHGPDMSNCAVMATALAAAGASEAANNADGLARAVSTLLAQPDERAKRAAAGAEVAAESAHVLDRVIEQITPWLDPLVPAEADGERPRSARA
jgi:3-deoxy-D-manno-octulosonic-acid transferase